MAKICTTIEQSKKLLELGVDVNIADMTYVSMKDYGENTYHLTVGKTDVNWAKDELGNLNWNDVYEKYIPAWSLSALLGLMPRLYEFENDPSDGDCQPNLCKGYNNNQWHIVYRSSIYITEWYDDPIDAAFEMVVWLLENKEI